MTTSDTAPFGAPVACQEAAMTPEETKQHLEDVHGIYLTDASAEELGVADWQELHQIDHDEWLPGPHTHECNPAHERIWHDPDVRLEQEGPDAIG